MKVAILGTGPSAAYVAMACEDSAVEHEIISDSAPVLDFPGAFWVRLNPTKFEVSAKEVYISSVGSAIDYLKKQWGMVDPDWLENTSFPNESRREIALNPYELFSQFWGTKDMHLQELTDENVQELAKDYDLVFQTFPTTKSRCFFRDTVVKFPIISYESDISVAYNSYCIYDGESEDFTVRVSSLFGYIHTEYGKDYIPKQELIGNGNVTWVTDIPPGTQPWNPAKVPADNVILVGRYAEWDREVLSHHAYEKTVAILEENS